MFVLSKLSFETRQLIRCFVAEVIATCLLIVLAVGGMKSTDENSDSVRLGLAITVVSMVTVRSNGAFQNPCMTLANWASGYEPSWQRTLILLTAEFFGSLLAAAFLYLTPFSTAWGDPVGLTSDYLIATLMTTTVHVLLLLSILNLNVTHGDPMYLYLLLPILLGISGTLGYSFTRRCIHDRANNSMNPAISLAVTLSRFNWYNHWIDWIGPFLGAVVASVLHRFVFQPRKQTPTTSL